MDSESCQHPVPFDARDSRAIEYPVTERAVGNPARKKSYGHDAARGSNKISRSKNDKNWCSTNCLLCYQDKPAIYALDRCGSANGKRSALKQPSRRRFMVLAAFVSNHTHRLVHFDVNSGWKTRIVLGNGCSGDQTCRQIFD
jgi:hypothetical protein